MNVNLASLKFHVSMKLYYSIRNKNGRKDRAEYETLFFLPLIGKSKYQ